MCDGSVQGVSQDVDLLVLDALATRKGAEVFSLEGNTASTDCHVGVP
jgi:hypothetical protein